METLNLATRNNSLSASNSNFSSSTAGDFLSYNVETTISKNHPGSETSKIFTETDALNKSLLDREVQCFVLVSQEISNYECGEIPFGTVLDLSQCNNLKSIKISHLNGELKLPPSITEFKVEHVATGSLLDLTGCLKLTSVYGGSIFDGILKLPTGLTYFECMDICPKGTVDLSNCKDLITIKVEKRLGTLLLPSFLSAESHVLYFEENNVAMIGKGRGIFSTDGEHENKEPRIPLNMISLRPPKSMEAKQEGSNKELQKLSLSDTHFTGGDVEEGIALDLSQYTNLTTVTVGDIYGKIKLPVTLTSFQCGGIFSDGIPDLSQYTNLTTVTVRDIYGKIKLPATLINFQCERVDTKIVLDLGPCTNLTAITVGKVNGKIKLPISNTLTKFKCGWLNPAITLDLSVYPNLTVVAVEEFHGNMKFPAALTSILCGSVGSNAELDLRSCTNLAAVTIEKFNGKVRCPQTVTSLQVGDIPVAMGVNFSKLSNLTALIIKGDIRDNIIKLPETLTTLESQDIYSSLDLSSYTSLASVKMGNIVGARIKLPANKVFTSFQCGNIQEASTGNGRFQITASSTLDLSSCVNLTELKVGNIIGSNIQFPTKGMLTNFQCGAIAKWVILDLSSCANLTELKVGDNQGLVLLSKRHHQALAKTVASRNVRLKWWK